MTRERTLAKNTLIISIGTFLPKLTSFITLPIVTAKLTQIEYGTYDLITTLVSFFLPLVTLQVQAAAFRFLIDHRKDLHKTKEVITNILAFIIPISIISLIVLFLTLSKLSITIRLLICIYFFLDILILTARQIVRGLAKNMLYSISAVVESVANMILVIGMLKLADIGIIGLLLSMCIATFLGLLILIIYGGILSKIDLRLLSKNLLKDIICYSWPLVPNVMSDWVLRLSDRMVITFFMGLDATAIYAVANKIPSLLTLVQNTFTYAWQENATLASKDKDEDMYYTHMFEVMSKLLSGATALLIACTPILFKILIKGEYQDAYRQMPLLLLGMLFSIYSSFIGGIYVAHKRTKSMGITTMAAAVVNFFLDILLIRYIGIYAASISTLISYFVLSIYRMIDVLKYHKIIYKINQMSYYLIVLIGMSIISWFNFCFLNTVNGIFGLVFSIYINKSILKSVIRSFLHRFELVRR